MSKVYFVRHSKPDFSVHDDLIRPLTDEGIQASLEVSEFLSDKNITMAFSSPYKRAIDTILDFTDRQALKIAEIHDFREREISCWLDDFFTFAKNQWNDFDYKLANGESLREVQSRNITALEKILTKHPNENIVIGTHGTALSTIINYYNRTFDYNEFIRIVDFMPFIVCMEFHGLNLVKIEEVKLSD